MATFCVTWTIDIDAETPEEAAREALKVQRDPQSTATFFDVSDNDGHDFGIDLEILGGR